MSGKERTPRPDDGEGWFNPWRKAEASLLPVVRDVAAYINSDRPRAVQSHRRELFDRVISAVVANLAFAAKETESGCIAVHMPTKRLEGLHRYRCPYVPVDSLKRVLLAMHDGGMLDFRKGQRGISATIQPTEAFMRHLTDSKVDAGDTVLEEGEELIILSRNSKVQVVARGTTKTVHQKDLLPYADDEETEAMRADVALINAHLAKADLRFIDDGEKPRVNVSSRYVRRHFNMLPGQDTPRFDQGGRLFGAFWTNLDRNRRRASLRINGEPIAEVDFNAMFTRLAYARVGQQLDVDGDPYTPIAEELGADRGAIKQAVNAFFFTTKPFTNWPEGMAEEMRRAGLKVSDVTTGVLLHLPLLEPFMWSTSGYGFMRTESDILIRGMKQLAIMGLTGLPLHDAVLVARPNAMVVKQLLEEAGLAVTGVRLPVGIKPGPEDEGE
jgi:hypothetical protein